MEIDVMNKEIEGFIHDLFCGFSTFVFASTNKQTVVKYGQTLDRAEDNTRKLSEDIPAQTLMQIHNYLNGTRDEELIRSMYSHILFLRSIGMIINNNDAISSMKMEKMFVEEENRQLKQQNRLFAEQLSEARSVLDSKRSKFDAVG